MIHLPTLDMLSMHMDLSFTTQEEGADILIWEYVDPLHVCYNKFEESRLIFFNITSRYT